jgi:hypothetical protein
VRNRWEDALAIQEGACNVRGIARSLVEAADSAAADGVNPGDCPAVALIVHQLAHLAGWSVSNLEEWEARMQACRDVVAAEPAAARKSERQVAIEEEMRIRGYGDTRLGPFEARAAAEATGCHGSFSGNIHKDPDGEVTNFVDAWHFMLGGGTVSVPAAGAGSYRDFFTAVGCTGCGPLETGSSAGDWTFVVQGPDNLWRAAYQENRYPYHGFRYGLSKQLPGMTFEEVLENLEAAGGL